MVNNKEDENKKPFAFVFWQSSQPTPAYIGLCAETHQKNLSEKFQLIQLDFESCLEWVPERDFLMRFSEPKNSGKSASMEGRQWALFCDLLRVALLHRHGGIWIDADTLILPNFSILSDVIENNDLVASESEGVRIANGIIGGRKNSPIIASFWEKLISILEIKQKQGDLEGRWGEYGTTILRFLLAKYTGSDVFIMPFGMVIPFDAETSKSMFAMSACFEKYIPPTALAVSLFNNSTQDISRNASAADLLAADSIFSKSYRFAMGDSQTKFQDYFFINRHAQLLPLNRFKLVRDVACMIEKKNNYINTFNKKLKDRNAKITRLKEVARKLTVKDKTQSADKGHQEKVFSTIYKEGLWEMGGSRSGCGSSLRQTETLRKALPNLLRKHNIVRLLDVPCGDFNWMQHVDLAGIDYVGGDIVPEIIEVNSKYENKHRFFTVVDIVNDQLPDTDCILCRDCYSHLPNEQVIASLNNIISSKAKFLLVTNYPKSGCNEDIAVGDFRRINFEKAPFYLPPPIDVIVENHPNPKHVDKSLALWQCNDIKQSIAKRQ